MAEHVQAIARRSIQALLASLYDTTGHRPHLDASCEFLGELDASTGLIVRRAQKRRSYRWLSVWRRMVNARIAKIHPLQRKNAKSSIKIEIEASQESHP